MQQNQKNNYLNKYDYFDGKGDRFKNCVSDYYEEKIDKKWEQIKDEGNNYLKSNNYDQSIKCYNDALVFILDPSFAIKQLQNAKFDESQQNAKKVFSIDYLAKMIQNFLQKPFQDKVVQLPNQKVAIKLPIPIRSAAICYSNIAAVLIQQGNYEQALKNSKKAIQMCPEFLKGHYRVMQCYKLLGDKINQKEKQEEINDYNNTIDVMPYYGCCLLACGWIDWQSDILIYQQSRQKIIFEWIHQKSIEKVLSLNMYLVPFQDAQCLVYNLSFTNRNFDVILINGIKLTPLDNQNGSDLEKPPHGIISKKSQQLFLEQIKNILRQIQDNGFMLFSLVLGQGLIEQVQIVQNGISQEFQGLIVQKAIMTQHGQTF